MILDGLFKDLAEEPKSKTFDFLDINPLSGSRKVRTLTAPANEEMYLVHERFIENLLELGIRMPNAYGAVKGSNPLKNVSAHLRRNRQGESFFPRYAYLTDISSAYINLDIEKLIETLCKYDDGVSSDEIRDFLLKYCSNGSGLYTGMPSSPVLFNIYCEYMIDSKLRPLCSRWGLTYTRYLDDLTFTASKVIGCKKRKAIRRIVKDAGFSLSDKKTQVLEVGKGNLVINGIGVSPNGRFFMPRHTVRRLSAMLHTFLSGKDLSVAPSISGLMGLFVHLTDINNPNKTEEKIIYMYQRFRKEMGWKRWKIPKKRNKSSNKKQDSLTAARKKMRAKSQE